MCSSVPGRGSVSIREFPFLELIRGEKGSVSQLIRSSLMLVTKTDAFGIEMVVGVKRTAGSRLVTV